MNVYFSDFKINIFLTIIKFFLIMMKKLFVTALMLFSFIIISNAQELKWYSWEEGYTKAKDEGKILLVDSYTEWCGWCKVMDNKTYSQEEIIKKIKADFIPVKFNPELKGEYEYNGKKYTGKSLQNVLAENNFRGYPTTFFVFTKTHKSYMEIGYKDVDAFSIILDKYKNMD